MKKKLALRKQTIRLLNPIEARRANGGWLPSIAETICLVDLCRPSGDYYCTSLGECITQVNCNAL